jgi:hypothetical protein
MKLAQYANQERAIAAAGAATIRQRWLWGLRLLHDEEKITAAGNLRHGVIEALIESAARRNIKLGEREIRRRLQCARTYPTEAQIGRAVADFETWHDLSAASFPVYEAPAGEPPADHRTATERERDRARALADLIGEQGSLFPLSQFEPSEVTLKDLDDYAREQEQITASFAETSRKRREYLARLAGAVGGDMSATWEQAQTALDAVDGEA